MSGSLSLTLFMAILCFFLPAVVAAAAPGKGETPLFPLSDDDECWRKLPAVQKGGGQPLPSWARALAGSMPRTTAALLRLDCTASRSPESSPGTPAE